MHSHHSDTFSGIEFGIQSRTLAISALTPTTPIGTRTVLGEGGKKQDVPVTPADQAKAAIKDGKISKAEQAALDKEPAGKGVIKDEQKRLAGIVQATQGKNYIRDDKGNLSIKDGKPENTLTPVEKTGHEKEVEQLAKGQNADQLQGRIDNLKKDGTQTGVADLERQKSERLAKESKVVDVVADKTAYVGTLEAEKAEIGKGGASTEESQQKLRQDAVGPLEKFIRNNGQVHDPDWGVRDDWKRVDGKVPVGDQFDKLAKQFKDDPKLLDQWVAHQGDSKDAVKNMEEHLKGLEDKPELHDKIAGRYEAAQQLKGIFEQYNAAKGSSDGGTERVKQIDAEIGITTTSIEEDKKVLSSESNRNLEKRQATEDGIIPPEPVEPAPPAPVDSKHELDRPAPNGGAGAPVDEKRNLDTTTVTPATLDIKVDYNTPEHRQTVLTKAQERQLLPAQHTIFDEKGQAVYTVQKNVDSYWTIANQSDGQANGFDVNHFDVMHKSNSARLGHGAKDGKLYDGEQVIIPNRSVEDLVRLLQLPATESVPTPPAEERPRRGSVV